ncbi:Pycsar system effector family protein [Streptomyces sp. 184]|uniref:Pycsar system effector family protein n=1 Tax=Streptomyces sp. 184 TaxID=1827526 RepID=UPI0038924884
MTSRGAGQQGPDSALYIAERLVVATREDVARADTKASIMLSGALALPVFVGSRVPKSGLGESAVLWAGAGGIWLLGVALLVGTVLPTTRTRRTTAGVTYYADALHDAEPAQLVHLVTRAGDAPTEWLLTQFRDLSGILARKYRSLRWGICCIVVGLALAAASLCTG